MSLVFPASELMNKQRTRLSFHSFTSGRLIFFSCLFHHRTLFKLLKLSSYLRSTLGGFGKKRGSEQNVYSVLSLVKVKQGFWGFDVRSVLYVRR